MTDEQMNAELQARAEHWKNTLHLKDWEITTEYVRKADYDLGGMEAQVRYLLQNKQAKIYITHPDERPKDSWFPFDVDRTLVHELLHIHISPVNEAEDEQMAYTLEEQAIESLARAFCDFGR